jgi:hypothetical protein
MIRLNTAQLQEKGGGIMKNISKMDQLIPSPATPETMLEEFSVSELEERFEFVDPAGSYNCICQHANVPCP